MKKKTGEIEISARGGGKTTDLLNFIVDSTSKMVLIVVDAEPRADFLIRCLEGRGVVHKLLRVERTVLMKSGKRVKFLIGYDRDKLRGFCNYDLRFDPEGRQIRE